MRSLVGVRPINGIDLASLDRFWEKWKLLDVRYRKDNGEQRFVYANDVAWQAIKDGKARYPEGAMLGKIAFHGLPDPAFQASVEPNMFSRLQIMKKDSSRYRDTDGWGYAVVTGLDESKETAAEDAQVAAACHACHRLVPERDYVFSRTPFQPAPPREFLAGFKDKFQAAAVQELGSREQTVLTRLAGKQGKDMVRYLPMPLFTGSADEASIALANYATEEHSTYFLDDPKSGHFVIADATPDAGAAPVCQPGTRVWLTYSVEQPALAPDNVAEKRLCGDLLTMGRIDKLARVLK